MLEFCELRVDEEFANLLFGSDEGKRLSDSVRKVTINTNDTRYKEIGLLQTSLRQTTGKPFFYGWCFLRKYTKNELESAGLFTINSTSFFEPPGEECGTKYDETVACSQCGAGAKQLGNLYLDWRKIPKSKDISQTIADEIIVSRRFVELFQSNNLTGAEFNPVCRKPSSRISSTDWFQLHVPCHDIEIVPPTKIGIGPFDEDLAGECRCSLGDLLGLNLLSEVSINRASYTGTDIIASNHFVGTRRGLLRPRRLLFISPRFRQILEQEKIKGFKLEIAHLI